MNEGKKSLLVIIISIIVLFISLLGIFIIVLREQKANNTLEKEMMTEVEIISYEGTYKARGIVVRAEENLLIIMPTIANNEYRYEEKFLYETPSSIELKQEQEVEITFHYGERNADYTYNAIIEKVEILQEKSNIEIPKDVIAKAYSSKEKIKIEDKHIRNSGISFTIIDLNEYKYNYEKMEYDIRKYQEPPEKDEIIETENGMATPGYDAWPEISKINNVETSNSYIIDENGKINIDINWSEIYGTLDEGTYRFTLSTVNEERQSIVNPNVVEYPYDGVIIQITFTVKGNSEVILKEIEIY